MDKLYGYREEDVIGLINFLKTKKGTLKNAFLGYAKISGKTQGTIRNLYYQIVKLSNEDKTFCDKYLNGKPLSSNRIEFFCEAEEKEMLKKIFILKGEGYSVRSAINKITNGEQKLALRYQNKYRDVIKNRKELVSAIIDEIKRDNPSFNLDLKLGCENKKEYPDLSRLKTEINVLYERLFLGIKRENEILLV